MKLKKGRRQCQDVLVVLVLLQHSPTLCQGELAFIGDAGDGWCVFLHSYNRVQDKATPPPEALALPGVHFYVADLLLSLSLSCADEATCMSGTGQLLQGRWLSTPSLSAPLSALGFRNPTAQVVKQQCAGNTGQSLWELVFPLPGHWATLPDGVCCSPPWGGHVGVVAAHPTSSPSPCYHLPLFTAWCTATGWQMWLCHTPWAAGSWMDTPATQHLDRWHGWSPVGLWTGALRRDLGEAVRQFMLPHGNTSMGDFQNPLSFYSWSISLLIPKGYSGCWYLSKSFKGLSRGSLMTWASSMSPVTCWCV